MYDIPHKLIINKRQVDLFKEYLLPFQGKQEDKLKTVFQTGQEVAVSI
jgi:hypothetical protein